MEFHREKNDTRGRSKREKPETTELKVNHPKKFCKQKRRQYKKENRDRFRKELQEQSLEGKYGEVYIWSAIDPESKIQFPDVVGTRGGIFGRELIAGIQARRANPEAKLLLQSDDYDVYEGLVRECFAEEIYSYGPSARGLIPKQVKMPKNVLYTVLKKQRNSTGVIESIDAKIVFGAPSDILDVLKKHNPTQGINTSYIERQNLNKRHFNARLRRQTIAFSKDYSCLVAQLNLQRVYANFCWVHQTLTKKAGIPTSPAMFIGKTDRVWGLGDVLNYQIAR